MRLFEGCILLLTFFTIILVLSSNFRKIKFVKFLPIVSLVFFIIHFFAEGLRWQLYPLYSITLISFIVSLLEILGLIHLSKLSEHRILRKFISVLMVVFFIISSFAAYAFPVYKMPRPEGNYDIGTMSFDFVDSNREEIYGNKKNENREIKIQVWYPAENTDEYDVVPWLEDGSIVSRSVAKMMGFPEFILDHTALIKSNSHRDAPINNELDKYPVVVISHGWTGFRNLHTDVAELLASSGYIVVGINHTYGSVVSVFKDGEVEYLDRTALPSREDTPNFLQYANNLVNTYAGDINFTLDELEKFNSGEINSNLKGKLDLTRIGLLGHSTGGGASVTEALKGKRVKAVMGLDAWVEPIKDDEIKRTLKIPSLFLRSEEWEEGPNNEHLLELVNNSKALSSLYEIKGVKHLDFTMVYMYSPLSKLFKITGSLDGRESANIQHDFIKNFFDKNLKGDKSINIENVSKKYNEVKEIVNKK